MTKNPFENMIQPVAEPLEDIAPPVKERLGSKPKLEPAPDITSHDLGILENIDKKQELKYRTLELQQRMNRARIENDQTKIPRINREISALREEFKDQINDLKDARDRLTHERKKGNLGNDNEIRNIEEILTTLGYHLR